MNFVNATQSNMRALLLLYRTKMTIFAWGGMDMCRKYLHIKHLGIFVFRELCFIFFFGTLCAGHGKHLKPSFVNGFDVIYVQAIMVAIMKFVYQYGSSFIVDTIFDVSMGADLLWT